MISKYSKKQWLILFVYSVVNLLCGVCGSLQGPFYPMVAESKGATPSQYGMVFGAYSFMFFLASPLSGILINKFSVVKISLAGILIIGVTNILFGFVDQLHGVTLFICISVVIRAAEGLGYSMVRNSGIATISFEFSENVEVAFAIIQTFFSVGYVIGPVVGGALYELEGFYLPFTVIGALLTGTAFIVIFLQKNYSKSETISKKQVLIMLRYPSVILSTLIIFGCFLNTSFTLAFLEPHIESLQYSAIQVGLVYVSYGFSYSLFFVFWSIICEKYNSSWHICFVSPLFIVCGLMLVGPAPYLPFDLNVYACLFGLSIHAVGLAGETLGGFSTLNKGALSAGLPKSIQTSGMVSAIFSASLALGLFVGPLVGGIILESFDFQWGSHFFMLYHIIVFFAIIVYIYLRRGSFEIKEEEIRISSSVGMNQNYTSIEEN